MPNYRRNHIPGGTYFFTVNLLKRKLPLLVEHINDLTHRDIHYNPVNHGWSMTIKEWPYSSFHRMVNKGIYPADWSAMDLESFEAGERRN